MNIQCIQKVFRRPSIFVFTTVHIHFFLINLHSVPHNDKVKMLKCNYLDEKNWNINFHKYLEPLHQHLKWIYNCMCIFAVNRTEHVSILLCMNEKYVTLICNNIWYWMGKEVKTSWLEPRWLPKSLTWRGFVHFSLSLCRRTKKNSGGCYSVSSN